MKKLSSTSAFTLIELLVVVAIIFILAAIMLPAPSGSKRSKWVMCMSQQRQIALGLTIFEGDNQGQFPWNIAGTNGGSLEAVSRNQAAPHFQAISKYIPNLVNLTLCPTEKNRQKAGSTLLLQDTNVSYFLNLDATTNGAAILGGERHLLNENKPVHPGLFPCSGNMTMNWSSELHGNASNKTRGGLFFGDGHVQFEFSKDLNSVIQSQPVGTNRFCVP